MKLWSKKRERIILNFTLFIFLFLFQITAYAGNSDIAVVTVENADIILRNGDVIELTGNGFVANDKINTVSLTLIDDNKLIIGDEFIQEHSLSINSSGVLTGSFILDQVPENATHVEVLVFAQGTNARGSNWIMVQGEGAFFGGLNIEAAGSVTISETTGGGDDDGLAGVSESLDFNGTGWTGTLNGVAEREYSNVGATAFIQSTTIASGTVSISSGTLSGSTSTTGSYDALTKSIKMRVVNSSLESTDSNRLLVPETDPPGLTTATVTSFTNIRLVFDEPVMVRGVTGDAYDNFDFGGTTSITATAFTGVGGDTTDTWDMTINSIASERNPDITIAYDRTNTAADSITDAVGNETENTVTPVTAADLIAPATPALTFPISSTIMSGANVTLTATADAASTDGSMSSVRFEGSNNGSTWTILGSDTDTGDANYSYTYTFGTKYSYYRAVAVDDAANETASSSTTLLTDAYRIEITSFDTPVDPGARSQFIIKIQDNYAQGVTYGSNLSFNLSTDAASGATFYDAASGGNPITSRIIAGADSDTVFWYEDYNEGTTPTVTVVEAASNLDDDNDAQQITINSSGIDHFHVTTSGSGTETAGTAFNVIVTAHDGLHATATGYTGSHSLTWSSTATNSPKDSVPEIPANGSRTFSAGILTITNGATFFDSGESPTLTVTDGSAVTTDGAGATGITVNDAAIAEVRIKTADETVDGNYANNVFGDSTVQGPTQANPDNAVVLYAVNYDDYGNLLADDETSTWGTTGTVPGSYSSPTGSTVTFTFNSITGSTTTGTLTNTSSGNTGATGTITVDDDDGATVTGFGITTDGDDNRYVYASWNGSSSGDDGSTGTPTDFEIVWVVEASGPIDTEGEWSSATSVGTAGKPAFSSGLWHIYMAGFPAGNKYFAIRTYDDVGNISVLGTGSYTTSSDYSLPVTLTSFIAYAEFSKITLSWQTESEIDNQGFNIYRSTGSNPNNWEAINSKLIPGAGNSSAKTSYNYVDNSIQSGETYHYRLESVSFNGVRELFTESTVSVLAPVPTEFALLNNYPNPFNPITNLKFQIPEKSEVTMKVYNIHGNLIKKLLSKETFEPGEYVVQWDATDRLGVKVATGVYFYQFISGNIQKIGKMMLIK